MHTYECIKGVLHGNAKRDLLWKNLAFGSVSFKKEESSKAI